MDKLDNSKEVSLPSASETEPQTILEKQNINIISRFKSDQNNNNNNTSSDTVVEKKIEPEVSSEEEVDDSEEESEESDSDNEVIEVKGSKKDIEKETIQFRKLSESSLDEEVDKEIKEILEKQVVVGISENPVVISSEPEQKQEQESVENPDEENQNPTPLSDDLSDKQSTVVSGSPQIDQFVEESEQNLDTSPIEEKSVEDNNEKFENTIDETDHQQEQEQQQQQHQKETLIDEDLLPAGALEQYTIDQKDRPPVPLQTYLWEEVRRAKEQGGYPWTHLTKGPLGPDEEPEIILKYKHSPRSYRKFEPDETESPKSQKKVRIQEEVSFKEPENFTEESKTGNNTEDSKVNDNNQTSIEQEAAAVVTVTPENHPPSEEKPKSILKRSQKILDTLKPHSSKFDSGSLRKKLNTPINKIRKMADKQFKKVKSTKTVIKKIPISKNENIVLEDETKILKLKESPKSRNRELPSYVVKQDSDDIVEIMELDESPTEARKRRELEVTTIIPDEIIELPVTETTQPTQQQQIETESQGSQEPTVEEILKEEMKNDPPPKAPRKHREHIYEEIGDPEIKITTPPEAEKPEPKLFRQNPIESFDPIFQDFLLGNKMMKKNALKAQDDKINDDMKLNEPPELIKQVSDEDRDEVDEKSPQKSTLAAKQQLLAPISSIDSTSSDEGAKAQLSIVAEESENSQGSDKKKLPDDSSMDEDVASLEDDQGSVISGTLIEEELKDGIQEKFDLSRFKTDSNESKGSKEETKEANEPEVEPATVESQQQQPEEIPKESETKPESQDGLQTPLPQEEISIKEIPSDEEEGVKEDVEVRQETPKAEGRISSRWSKMSDHEYEPIGEPPVDQPTTNEPSEQEGAVGYEPIGPQREKQLLRTATDDSADNVSAQDFQNDIESRFFSKTVEHIEDNKENVVHPEDVADEAVVIDEEPVVRTIPSRKRNLLTSAQEQGKNIKKKISTQAGIIRTTIHNKMKKKPKEKPVAVEVAQIEPSNEEVMEDQNENVPQEGQETENLPEPPPAPIPVSSSVQEVSKESETMPKKSLKLPKIHRPEFTKKISKPTMPKFKKPNMPKISLPDRSKMPDMPKIKMPRLGRSKSLKEPAVTEGVAESSVTTPDESVSAAPTKKKFNFDFGTYPRLFKDKFKRQKLDRSDRSVRADTPPILEFTTVTQTTTTQRGPVASRWINESEEPSVDKYNQFGSDLDRESSIERRLQEEFEKNIEEEEFEARRLMSEAQRQMDEFDRENQEIHERARQEKQRRPIPIRQESEASEDNQMLWSGTLNKDVKQDPNLLTADESFKITLEDLEQHNINRSSTPHTNQETQSSGSSGAMRRKGVIEEIDDDEFILRKKGISNENIGEYISETIREGLSQPENGLAGIGQFDDVDLQPERPQRSLRRKPKTTEEQEIDTEHFNTFPPNRPTRKQRRYEDDGEQEENEAELPRDYDEDVETQQVPDINDFDEEVNNNNRFYDEEMMKAMHADLMHDDDSEMEFMTKLPVPPTPPRRRKKKIEGHPRVLPIHKIQPQMEMIETIVSNVQIPEPEIKLIRAEHQYAELVEEIQSTKPTPIPRARSRSQVSGRTSHDADSIKHDHDSNGNINNAGRVEIQHEGVNGYAVVQKLAPPRPPAPVRRKRSTRSLGERQFATMPHIKNEEDTPQRPTRNYSTINPSRPPRRKSATSLGDVGRRPVDDDDYEEIEDKTTEIKHDALEVAKRLQTGDVINKFKDRPLPPPPRPKRENKKQKKPETDDKDDKDGGAERVIIELSELPVEPKVEEPVTQSVMDTLKVDPSLSRLVQQDSAETQESDFSQDYEIERPIEVEVSTQTDPVPEDDLLMDDEYIDDEDYTREGKTLEEILREEQEAEIERARQLAEAENLSRGIQRFRESNQRSYSERSRTSADGRKTPLSGRITPAAVIVERKKSSPIIFNDDNEVVTEAALFVHPIEMEEPREIIRYEDELPEPEIQEIEQQTETQETLELEQEELETAEPQPELEVTQEFVQIQPQQPAEELPQEEPEIDFEALVDEIVPHDDDELFDEVDSQDQLDNEDRYDKINEFVESILSQAQNTVSEQQELLANLIRSAREPELELELEPEPEQEPEEQETVPPVPPPRKKSLDILEAKEDEVEPTQTVQIESTPYVPEIVEEPIQPEAVPEIEENIEYQDNEEQDGTNLQSNRLHLSNLEVDNLSVSSIQAGKISVSELESHSITTNEFDCKSGSVVSRSIEIPAGLIEEIVEKVRESQLKEQQQQSAQAEKEEKEKEEEKVEEVTEKCEEPKESTESKDVPPQRPPPPHPQYMYPDYPGFSVIPPAFYQMRNYSDEEVVPPTQAAPRRRRQVRKHDSTSEEEYQREQRTTQNRSRNSTQSPEPSVGALGAQFARACATSIQQSGRNLMEMLRASSKDENKRDLHIALIILIIIIAGLMMLGMGDKAVHHHHWDYFNPPDNPGRS